MIERFVSSSRGILGSNRLFMAAICTSLFASGGLTACDDGSKKENYECVEGIDCESGVCDPIEHVCLDPQCGDGVQNGDEGAVDCAGSCPLCEAGTPCEDDTICASGVCDGGFCADPACGDGVVNAEEDCDEDGVDTAQCDADCTLVSCGDGYMNAAADETCDSFGVDTQDCNANCTLVSCGDAIHNVEAGEACDDGGVDTADCDANCTLPTCGDGYLNTAAGEACDEGGVDTEVCNADCTLPVCGDGYLNTAAGEACDEGAVNTLTCDADCSLPECGDGFTNDVLAEACDDGNADNNDACLDTCTLNDCGDGYVFTGVEECDDGNADNSDTCLDTCILNICGDGFVFPGVEECDDGNADNGDACLDNCILNICGDGFVLAGAEECDDANLIAGDGCNPDCLLENRIVNGSFETADYTGWILQESSGSATTGMFGVVASGTALASGVVFHDFFDDVDFSYFGPAVATLLSTEGNYLGIQLQNGPENHRLCQFIFIPPGITTLTWDMRYINHAAAFNAGTQYLAVNIRDEPDGGLVSTLYQTTAGVDPLQLDAMTPFSADLSAYQGQTVVIEFEFQFLSHPMEVMFDNIRTE